MGLASRTTPKHLIMSMAVSRVIARRQAQLLFQRRYASTAAETAQKTAGAAKETASQAQSKASEGLSRVTSTAGDVGGKGGGVLGGIGGRTGRLIGFVNSMIPPTIYYSKVGVELAKLVAKDQKMALPSSEAFTNAYRSAWKSISSGSAGNALSSVRSAGYPQLVGLGIVGAELLGFFSVGEILGRFKLVGYRGGKSEEHH